MVEVAPLVTAEAVWKECELDGLYVLKSECGSLLVSDPLYCFSILIYARTTSPVGQCQKKQ